MLNGSKTFEKAWAICLIDKVAHLEDSIFNVARSSDVYILGNIFFQHLRGEISFNFYILFYLLYYIVMK
jgi:hypothetical protein